MKELTQEVFNLPKCPADAQSVRVTKTGIAYAYGERTDAPKVLNKDGEPALPNIVFIGVGYMPCSSINKEVNNE